jgi:hypothetical protein
MELASLLVSTKRWVEPVVVKDVQVMEDGNPLR